MIDVIKEITTIALWLIIITGFIVMIAGPPEFYEQFLFAFLR